MEFPLYNVRRFGLARSDHNVHRYKWRRTETHPQAHRHTHNIPLPPTYTHIQTHVPLFYFLGGSLCVCRNWFLPIITQQQNVVKKKQSSRLDTAPNNFPFFQLLSWAFATDAVRINKTGIRNLQTTFFVSKLVFAKMHAQSHEINTICKFSLHISSIVKLPC